MLGGMGRPHWMAACVAGLAAGAAGGQTPSFDLLGEPSSIYEEGLRVVLSADGRTAASGDWVWNWETGLRRISAEPGAPSGIMVTAMSRDGRTLAGTWGASNASAFRYRGPGTFESLGAGATNARYRVLSIADDGNTLCGYQHHANGPGTEVDFPILWAGGAAPRVLDGRYFNTSYGQARGLTADGSAVVGYSVYADDAWVWTPAGGPGLLDRPFTREYSTIRAEVISGDGRVVAGTMAYDDTAVGVVWRDGLVRAIEMPAGYHYGYARAMSEDGSVVCFGISTTYSMTPWGAAVWTGGSAMTPLADYLRGAGVLLPEGWEVMDCTGVSADGLTFAGALRSVSGETRAFVATVPAPGTLAIVIAGAAVRRRRRA